MNSYWVAPRPSRAAAISALTSSCLCLFALPVEADEGTSPSERREQHAKDTADGNLSPSDSSALPLRISLLQMHSCGWDQEAALRKADSFCRRAAKERADIALMPEMFNIGYTGFEGVDDAAVSEWRQNAVSRDSGWVQHFRKLAQELDMAIAVTYLEKWEEAPRNTITVYDRHGKEVLTYAKVHTCDFSAMEASMTPGEDWYVGDLDTRRGRVTLGAMICYDREFPESARVLMLKGAEVVLTPNACHLGEVRLAQFGTRAFENQMVMAMANYANGNGCNGASTVYSVDGRARIQAGSEEGLFTATVDVGPIRRWRSGTIWGNAFRRPHRYKLLTSPEKDAVYDRTNAFGKPFVAESR